VADEPSSGAGVPVAAGRRPRRRLRLLLRAVAVLVTLLVVAGVVAYVQLDRNINTFSSRGISRHRPPATVAGQNILLIGSDTRAGADRGLGGSGSAVGRSDTALLVHIYRGGRRAVSVSIPRDALVDIPRCLLPDGSWSRPQRHAMFNAAFSVGHTKAGNPTCTVNTVERLTGLRVDHTIVADFSGFAAMTDILGGVRVCLPSAIYQDDLDPNRRDQGDLVFHPGLQDVSGQKALDFVRLRHGVGDGSDIGRMRRQQAFLGSVVAKVRAEGLTPTHLLPLARAATRYLTVDPGLGSARQLLTFLVGLRHMAPENMVFVTAPWRYDGPRVALVHPDVDRLWAALRSDEPITAARRGRTHASTVAQALATVSAPVAVVDPAAVRGRAARAAAALRAAGLTVPVATPRTPRRTVAPGTEVEHGPGQGAQARALASAFAGAVVRATGRPGLRVVLGTRHRLRDAQAPARTGALPGSVTRGIRSAVTNPCSGISYGVSATP
jgi:LCP family protein required for cell wall assembly